MVSKSISFALKLSSDQDADQRKVMGEVALLGAVVRTAMRDWLVYRNNANRQYRKLAEDARHWIFESEGEENSFITFCELIGADATIIRENLCREASRLGCRTPEVLIVAARGRTESHRVPRTAIA